MKIQALGKNNKQLLLQDRKQKELPESLQEVY